MFALITETICYLLFFFLVLKILKSGKSDEIVSFILPVMLFYFFIEFMSVNNQKYVFSDEFSIFIFNVPLSILVLWVVLLYFCFSLTEWIARHYSLSLPIYKLSALDSVFAVLISILLEPIPVKLGLWRFLSNPIYFGIPVWNFIGKFLSVGLFSLGYRGFKNIRFKKRIILTYLYIFLILVARFIAYKFV